MSISDRTEIVFTDRHKLIRLFLEYLNEDSRQKQILFFYGDGGNGKSSLLKFLQSKCCKRLRTETWQALKSKPDAEVADYIKNRIDSWEFTKIPAVIHDFGGRAIAEDQPQDPFYGLLMLRRGLSKAGEEVKYTFRFPLYSYACVWYLYQTGKLEKAKQMLPAEEMDVLAVAVDAFSEISWGSIVKAALGLVGKQIAQRWGGQLSLMLKRRGIGKEDIEKIHAMGTSELINELPRLFAADLKAAMQEEEAPKKIVLLFDSHEAFWSNQRESGDYRFFQRDEWLRYLLLELSNAEGIVTVVAGREQPLWANAPKKKHQIKSIDKQNLDFFSQDDATYYFRRSGIKDESLISALINYSSVRPNFVHPQLAALCVDLVKHANSPLTASNFETKAIAEDIPREVIGCILRDADRNIEQAVYALSACRAFNQDLYFQLADKLRFQGSDANFEILTRFSFVWQLENGWYRIHDLIRRFHSQNCNPITLSAHDFLNKYYREINVSEEIYHLSCQDRLQGLEKFALVLSDAVKREDLELCRTLQSVREELNFYLVK